jgi:hypothetical protein
MIEVAVLESGQLNGGDELQGCFVLRIQSKWEESK